MSTINFIIFFSFLGVNLYAQNYGTKVNSNWPLIAKSSDVKEIIGSRNVDTIIESPTIKNLLFRIQREKNVTVVIGYFAQARDTEIMVYSRGRDFVLKLQTVKIAVRKLSGYQYKILDYDNDELLVSFLWNDRRSSFKKYKTYSISKTPKGSDIGPALKSLWELISRYRSSIN